MCAENLTLQQTAVHRDVIATFGLFPHRNAILGRRDTVAEKAFLESADSSF